MGRFAYYAPLLVVAALAVVVYVDNLEELPGWEPWRHVVTAAGAALVAGLGAQLIMIGMQGVFAQVLPVPGGRSIRGRGATYAGGMILLGFLLLIVALVFGVEELQIGTWLFAGISLAPFVVALGIYLWSLPTAVKDFEARI